MASYWSIIRAYIQITILTKSEGPPFSQKKILRIFHSKDKNIYLTQLIQHICIFKLNDIICLLNDIFRSLLFSILLVRCKSTDNYLTTKLFCCFFLKNMQKSHLCWFVCPKHGDLLVKYSRLHSNNNLIKE